MIGTLAIQLELLYAAFDFWDECVVVLFQRPAVREQMESSSACRCGTSVSFCFSRQKLSYITDSNTENFEHHNRPFEIVEELKTIFQTQIRTERYKISEKFFTYKMEEEERSSMSEHAITEGVRNPWSKKSK
jgi:hypothetical protein